MGNAQHHSDRGLLIALCGTFFLSGASALAYQLLWLRTLGLIFGVTVYAASTVWASFMAGLAIGSVFAGRLADRAPRPLLWFAGVEASIALTAAITTVAFSALQHWYQQLVPGLEGSFVEATALRFAVAFLLMILPTALMGATLPFVVKAAMRAGSVNAIGVLYGSNTTGAIAGAVAAGLWLIPVHGMRATLAVAAALNVLAAGSALLVSRVRPPEAVDAAFTSVVDGDRRAVSLSASARAVVLATFTVSGAVALALEVVWLRSATIILGPTVYTVAVLLATILAGIALGSYCITPFLARIARPLPVLAALEASIAFAILFSLVTLPKTPVVVEALPASLKAWLPPYLVAVVVGGPLVAFPTSWLMGLAFPLGLQVWTEPTLRLSRSASRVGVFYALNVCAGVAGALGAGFLLLPILGSRLGINLLAAATLAASIGLVLVSTRSWMARAVVSLGLIATFVVVAGRLPDPVATLLALRVPAQPVVWREEGIQTTASIHTFLSGRRMAMYLDGYHQAANDGATLRVHYKIGTLPVALHPDPRNALVVGLGGGATAGAMSRYDRLIVDVVELSDTVVRASDFFRQANFELLTRPNVHLRIDDGRNFLLSTRQRYDIITADTIQPVRAGSASLYSKEYFTLVRDRLNDEGIAMQWFAGTDEEYRLVARTFANVFPYVTLWDDGSLLVGTKQPLRISPESFNPKLQVPGLKDALAAIDIRSFDDLLREFWGGPIDPRQDLGDGPLLTDDRPILEYFLAMPRDKPMSTEALKGDVRQILRE